MSTAALLHTREQFSLTAKASFDVAWPLFGADKERAWAPHWEPVFLWPEKPFDQEGMVFKIRHGERSAVWVNTAFDRAARRFTNARRLPKRQMTS